MLPNERSTRQRHAILAALRAAQRPLLPTEILELAQHDTPGIGIATIYRNLIDLTEAGLVRRSDVGDHVWRFELLGAEGQAHEDREHAHFVCDSCGDVQCLPAESVKLDVGRGAPRSVRKNAVAIQLRGTCDDCER